MTNNQSQQKTIDPKVINELQSVLSEEEIVGMGMREKGSEEKIPLVEGWFPQKEEWSGKTNISLFQAHNIALAKTLSLAFPELKPLEKFIQESLTNYEMLLTSVEGVSREQQMNVLMSMFGGGSKEQTESQTALMTALAGNLGDED